LPILSWAPKYNAEDAVGDVVAGITVGLTVIPQSLPYALLAGLPPEVCIPSLVIYTDNWV
jgi:sodium-independent sulfate anion transporter 11